MPQPVDLQTEMARVAAAERIQQIADRLSLAAQQRAAEATEEERILEETQVQESNETDSREIERDGRRRNPFSGRRKRRDANQEQEASPTYNADEEKEFPEDGGQHLDVTV